MGWYPQCSCSGFASRFSEDFAFAQFLGIENPDRWIYEPSDFNIFDLDDVAAGEVFHLNPAGHQGVGELMGCVGEHLETL